ncbi:MAG TPA: FG-GAP-like repeat-containing protein [Gemmatimonadaceae bacterium]|nr:FG-GAP-like repeat-containing protein [Gemmatimonadaceae bacterium]
MSSPSAKFRGLPAHDASAPTVTLARRLGAVALVVAACRKPVDVSWHQEAGYRWRTLDVATRGAPGFAPLAARRTGLTHVNEVDDEHALANRNLLIGAGVALGDVDEDGLPDVFLASVERPAALYRNAGDFHFSDITAASGIRTDSLATLSAAFADVNGDGHLDLLVGTLGGPLKLWIGDGHGHFTDATASSGLPAGFAATALTLADVDGDGDLDLYVGTYKTRNALDRYPPQEFTVDRVVRKVGNQYQVEPRWASEFRIEDRPDLGAVVRSQRAEPDLFFINDGRGHFAREPMAGPRFLDERGHPLTTEPDYFTLAARFYDVNGDGAPDLYVCNDFEDPDQFWLNDGKGTFRLAPALALRESSNTCMSVEFGDVNRDGHVDFFTADMMSMDRARRQREIATNTPLPKSVGLSAERQQWMRNMLQLGRGDGTWADISMFAGVGASEWTWGSAFLDVDLDGFEDLLVVNGHRWDVRDADTYDRLRNSSPRIAWNREQGAFPRHDAHSVAFHNTGALGFTNASAAWHFGVDSAITHGIALADLDGDGDLDVVVTRLDAPPVVYRTQTTAPRVAVRLRGPAPNVAGIGATVTIRAPSLPAQTREMMPTGYYLSGSDAELAFATGRDTVVQIEVRWPLGRTSTITARPNRLYEVDAASATAGPPAQPDSSGPGLFEDATSLLGGHTHVDSAFDDYRRQPLLPNKFSQLGPGVSWIDVDADGREDLVVGAGRGGRLTVLRNRDGRFVPTPLGTEPVRWDLTTILPAPAAPGEPVRLLAGQSSYEANSAAEALAVAPVIELAATGGSVPTPRLSPDTASIGPLALGDIDGDGRLELFVGARIVPGAWPLPARSHLYRSDGNGGWTPDSVNDRAVASLGLVSQAIFTDLDGDGRPELVATSEWGPIRVLHNDTGRLRDVTAEWGLKDLRSRWNGLAAGDFDGDGRLDLVVTSWGRNTPWQATPDQPYALVTGNFGGAGLGLLFAQYDSSTGREMPTESFSRVANAIPAVKTRFSTYARYAAASVGDILGDASNTGVRVGATTFDHLLLLNRGGRFEVRSLPAEAQLAPAFAPVVADFDGDGNEDLFLAQNFSPTALETPRLDAGAGLVMLGDGRGGFRALGVRQSGVTVLGDQRGAAAADYDGDGRVDLAVSQNGAATTLWHNREGRPGIRVRLNAGRGNPLGIGARVQIAGSGRRGPVRELHAGAGYWSMDAATTVLSLPPGADSLIVHWPGGREEAVPLKAGQREVTLSVP